MNVVVFEWNKIELNVIELSVIKKKMGMKCDKETVSKNKER